PRALELREAVAAGIAEPAVIDGEVFARLEPPDPVVARVELDIAAHAASGADAGRAVQVPGAADEAILPRGQRADRADLRPVALVVRLGGFVVEGADDGLDAALDERQLAFPRDLLAEPRAAPAEDAALAVEDDLVGERHPFVEMRLLKLEAAGARTVLKGLVLQRALAALVADGAVEGVVDEEKLEHPLLVLADLFCRRLDDHALGDVDGAGRLQLRHLLDFDQAHAADRHGRHLRVRAENRDVDVDRLGGVENQRSLGHGDGLPVDRQRDLVGLHRGHQATASCAVLLKGHPFCETCSRNSSRKNLMTLRGNQVEASPSGQKERPSMLYPMSRSRSTSVAFASPASKRSKRFDIQKVPSRQGVHLPQLSWWKKFT